MSVMVGSRAAQGRPIEDVNIIIPFPAHTLSSQLSANTGTVQFDETSKECTWRIGKLPNDKTPSLSGFVTLAPGGRPGRPQAAPDSCGVPGGPQHRRRHSCRALGLSAMILEAWCSVASSHG